MSGEWVVPGADVAVINSRGWRSSVTMLKVDRLTKTQIVLDNGKRFNRERLREVGDNYGDQICRIDDPKVLSIQAQAEISRTRNNVWGLLDDALSLIRQQRTDGLVEKIAEAYAEAGRLVEREAATDA